MSKMLNLVDILLSTGRNLVMMGRFTEALVPLSRLADFRKLPVHVLEEICTLRAEIHLQQKNYKEARRNLAGAIAARPLEANHLYLMAIAIEQDDQARRERAEIYFQQAVELEPDVAAYWVDFGSYLFTMGKTQEALKAIRKAFAIDSTDAEIVGQVAEILRREGYQKEATRKLRAALFENHGAHAFRQLWQQNRLALIRAQQECPRTRRSGAPVLLPFTPGESQGKYLELGGKTIRIDQAETLDEPKNQTPMSTKRPPRKG